MSRGTRRKSGTGIYHVMIRGINRQDIFEDDGDYQKMVKLLKGQAERFDNNGLRLPPFCTIYAYCLMSNHVHLLLQERESPMSETVRRLGISYASYFNKKYQREGHLFQDRFRSEPVDTIEYFVTLLRYIHQNPVKAGLVTRPVDYVWSSWLEYELGVAGVCAVNVVLNRVGSQNLIELVNTDMDEFVDIVDIDNDNVRMISDDEVREYLRESQGIANPLMVQSLEKARRNTVLKAAKGIGAGIRQLSRLTGVSFGVIQKL